MSKNDVEKSISLCTGINDCCSGMNTILVMTALYKPNISVGGLIKPLDKY